MDGDIVGVRIIPPVIEFLDAEAETIHVQTVTVQNISHCSRQIKFHGPNSEKFKLLVENPDRPVAPGLEVKATIEFCTAEAEDCQDRLILLVDEDVIEVPLCVYGPQPLLELNGPVNFGSVLRNCKVLAKEISIANHGSLPGNFLIQYNGDKPIKIFPNHGTLQPSTAQTVKIEFVSKFAGTLEEEADVQLDGQEPSTLQISAKVIDCSLVLISPQTGEPIECIEFGSTYYGTDKTLPAILYNNSPDTVKFVSVLHEEAEGMEAGSDLTKSTLETLASQDMTTKAKKCSNALTSLVKALPPEGVLPPYEKIPVFFRFSPRYSNSKQGWKGTSTPPPRQDFVLFMNIAVVGSHSGFGQEEEKEPRENDLKAFSFEVALTGTALPVLVDLSPQASFDFNGCPVNEHVDVLSTLRNDSTVLPLSFVFKPIAQFCVHPASGKLKPGETKDIIVSFKPNQYGNFRTLQLMEVLGAVADIDKGGPPLATHLEAIHTLHILLTGSGVSVFKKKEPKFNPGITPLVVGEVGQFVEVKVEDAVAYEPRAAMLGSTRTKGMHTTKATSKDSQALVAYPNDRARSIRPSYRREQYKTIFTKTDRHTYVDPDYAYNEEELADVQAHKNKYNTYVQDCRSTRVAKQKAQEFTELNNQTDLGIKSAAGLRPPKPKAKEVQPTIKSPVPPEPGLKMLSLKELAKKERDSMMRPTSGGLNAVPMTATEKADCKKNLTPQQLHQIIIGPPTIDFGEVCLKSNSMKRLSIVNSLNQFIHVVMEIDCRELRQSSPLSQVVPPNRKTVLPLVFESNTKGKFQRNVKYTVNGHHHDHVIVCADVVPVALELASSYLELKPTPGLPAEAGLRDVITLRNKRNYPAEFTWQPVLGDRGTAFSIRPATGTVDAFQDLECEVVFHPSYHAPEDGEFIMQVHNGEPLSLKCHADLGVPQVMFMERRVLFGQVPLHLKVTRTAVLHNTSQNHAYFQVLDPNPVPGLTVSPIQGVVPVGGTTELKIHLTAGAIMKFDTRLAVEIRGWRNIELRMGGTVEPPLVDIDIASFQLGGVYCGSSLTVPFKLINKVRTNSLVVFDLSRYRDFTMKFDADVMEESEDFLNPGVFKATVKGSSTLKAELIFTPTEVASYDFIIPVCINQTEAPSPDATPLPPTPAPSSKSMQHIITPRPVLVTVATPKRRIVATALRQPIQISHHYLDFSLPSGFLELGVTMSRAQMKGTVIRNNSSKTFEWSLDPRGCGKALEEGIFQFVSPKGVPFLSPREGGGEVKDVIAPGESYNLGINFCPTEPGVYSSKVPIVLNGNRERPYQYMELFGVLQAPHLTFDPLAIVLTPVPLSTPISASFTIQAGGFKKATVIDVELPEIEASDGSKLSPLDMSFPEGQTIQPCCAGEGQVEPFILKCKIDFCSPKPVSFTKLIKFIDTCGNSFSIPVTATADNCLLSAYPFIAQHRAEYQICTEQGRALRSHQSASKESLNGGEAVIMAVESPTRPATHSSSTSSRFGVTSSTYEESETMTESTYPSTPRDGAVNHASRAVESHSTQVDNVMGLASRSLGSAAFPNEDTDEGMFHHEVLSTVQRWITLHGWLGGPFPVTVPHDLRSGVSKGSAADAAQDKNSNKSPATNNQKKSYTKTIYDLLAHLSGRPVPGIPVNQALPSDPTERVLQLHWQHTTMLTFLRTQGALISYIKPEYLFEPQDYQRWSKLQEKVKEKKKKMEGGKSAVQVKNEDPPLDEVLFESVSKRAWTDLLLQTLKALVLARITPRHYKNLPTQGGVPLPSINPDPVCSNVYCVGERILLSWLNHHYEQQRHKIWKNGDKGGIPPSRWVVNFDYDLLDGLVLGAILAAHVPFLVKKFLVGMYTHPSSAEQCLHNALKVVTALRYVGLDYDIQAIDITDPNPISLLLLCVHLYQRLPQYTPKTTVEFVGALHQQVMRQVQLTNPSNKPLIYHALIAGLDARDFTLPKGDTITIPPKSKHDLQVIFKSRFLRPSEGVLVLVGRRAGSATGTTLVFNLRTTIDNVEPTATIRCESCCYELHGVDLEVYNPFKESGEFQIILTEPKNPLTSDRVSQNEQQKRKGIPLKRVKSKTDHGQQKERAPSPPKLEDVSTEMTSSDTASQNSPFFCHKTSIFLEAESSGMLTVGFLPFHLGNKYCSVLLVNENIGELIYSIEASVLLPVPSALPYSASRQSVRISSAAAAGTGRGLFGGNDEVVYWRCDNNTILKEELIIPIKNDARERALIMAAQQKMSETEVKRRRITGTLASATVTASIATLKLTELPSMVKNAISSTSSGSQNGDLDGTMFEVELSSMHFQAPEVLFMPSPLKTKSSLHKKNGVSSTMGLKSPPGLAGQAGVVIDDGTISLPIKFTPKGGGHYPCQVVLKSPDDVRVYQIECIVNPEGSAAEIEFVAPVHQSVSQDIPIVNQTDIDWFLTVHLEGNGFYGPTKLLAKKGMTTNYPLMFRPSFESLISGKLILINQDDGTEHHFKLKGEAQKPLALDHVLVECHAREKVERVIMLPNVTSQKLTFRVISDLPILAGNPTVTVLPGKEEEYQINISPWKRGTFRGVISFIAGGTKNLRDDEAVGIGRPDSSKSLISTCKSSVSSTTFSGNALHDHLGYRIWYSVEIQSTPAPPEKCIDIVCAAQSAALMEVDISNPTGHDLTFDVLIDGDGLQGEKQVKLGPRMKKCYQLVYAPAIVGQTVGSLIFQNETVGEFWYSLRLTANTPAPTTLPHLVCELGKWCRQLATLANPTEETLELVPTCSNTNNFSLELEQEKRIVLAPHSTMEIPIQFMPSALGEADHSAVISFSCEQLGDWRFLASGTGLTPLPVDPVSISATLGSNTSIIIPFRNPTDEHVLIDVILTDNTDLALAARDELLPNQINAESAFCLLLKHTTNIPLAPKATFDIPLTFAPGKMNLHEALCVVSVRREDGQKWEFQPSSNVEIPHALSNSRRGLRDIRWLFPIHGIPETQPAVDKGAVINCQARSRIEERLEVTLTGAVPCSASAYSSIQTRAITPKDQQVADGVVMGEGNSLANEFSYEILYGNEEAALHLEHAVSLNLIRKQRDKLTGMVSLVFNIIYAPFKVMKHDVQLCVTSATGGIWRFPIRFVATEPTVDDIITIESVGLDKEAAVGFRLTSQARHPSPFNAYFVAGSDLELTVSPQAGELLPVGTQGTLITVSFIPKLYGKSYHGKLVIQTSEMQWTYSIMGVTPEYTPPSGKSDRPIAGPHPNPLKRSKTRNFVAENLNLTTTAISSPIKGALILTQ